MLKNKNQINLNVTFKSGIFFVLSAGILWSTVGLGVRLIDEASVWQILFFRSISLTIFLLLVIYFLYKQNPLIIIIDNFYPSAIGGLALFLAYLSGIYSIQMTTVANAMMLFATAPFITAILGRIVLKERVKIVTWIALITAIIGVFIMVYDKNSDSDLKGNFSAFVSAISFSIFTLSLRWGKSGNMLPSVFLSGIFGILITTFICFQLGLTFFISINDLSISLTMGVFQVGTGLVLYTLGSKALSATELTLVSMSEPLLGPFWVWLLLNEKIDMNTIIGAFTLFTAIIGNVYFSIRQHR